MGGLKQRILSSVILVPILVLVIILLPQLHHLAFCLLFTAITALGAVEMRRLLEKDGEKLSILSYGGVLLPAATYIQLQFLPGTELAFYTLIFLAALSFFSEVFHGAHDDFRGTRSINSGTLLSIIYPGLFASFVIRIAFLPSAVWFILLFLLLVFGSDTCAYIVGIAFGRNNRGIIKVSPNKSVAGFIGGILIPAVIGMLSAWIFPDVFTYSRTEGFLLGGVTAAVAAAGDLIESSFKRSAAVKDSGTIVPGRGGVLDSIDSIVMAAPAYIAMITLVTGV